MTGTCDKCDRFGPLIRRDQAWKRKRKRRG